MDEAKNVKIMNKAIFRGTIVSIRGENGNGSITLACPLITSTRRDGKVENGVRVNYPALSFNKTTKTEGILEKFKRGDRVYVEAHLQSYVRMDDFGEAREMLNIYIDNIEKDTSKAETVFGKEGRTYPEPVNEVYLSAKLAGITKRTESIIAFRFDLSDEKRNLVNAIYFRAPAGVASEMAIGDSVDVLAMVQTVDTRENKRARNYQELVILDIFKQ